MSKIASKDDEDEYISSLLKMKQNVHRFDENKKYANIDGDVGKYQIPKFRQNQIALTPSQTQELEAILYLGEDITPSMEKSSTKRDSYFIEYNLNPSELRKLLKIKKSTDRKARINEAKQIRRRVMKDYRKQIEESFANSLQEYEFSIDSHEETPCPIREETK